jgi:hypothetical protein
MSNLWPVQLNEFNGKPQLLAKIGKGSACHYCLFDKKMGVNLSTHSFEAISSAA